MTTEELKYSLRVKPLGYGSYKVTIEYRNKKYTCLSHNSLAYDRINSNDWVGDKEVHCTYTKKQALQALYDECKQKNNIGQYSY